MCPFRNLLLLLASFVALAPGAASAGVVVNEVFYNAPDDLDDVQWIELYNAADRAADVSGWTLDDGKAAGARMLARDAQLLKDHLTKRRQFLLGQKELQDGASPP